MKTLEQLGIRIPQILLPKNIDISSWSVIACDQYTQDRDYWKKVEENTKGKASTLNLILPEVYLNDGDKAERIAKIRQTMKSYLDQGIFDNEINGFIYLERKTAFGRVRKGLVAQIDLESYEWKPFSKANIRATEATIIDRIPPRKEIRKGAPLELPHIMLLVNDKDKKLLEGIGEKVSKKKPLYQGELMSNGGSITGWEVSSNQEIEYLTQALNEIAQKNSSDDGSTFLFAVGDGNHSLATAKAVWDEHKEELIKKGADENQLKNDPVRFALIEIVNIYDQGLTFEPIHRVIFNIKSKDLIQELSEKLQGSCSQLESAEELEKAVKESWANFGFVFKENGIQNYILMKTQIKELAVSRLQPEIDNFLKSCPDSEIDYIHGSQEVFRLGSQENALTILLPPIAKDSFFDTINGRGPLPRKSFSMGEADEKRFYLECRRLFS
ncbi:MAG: DUF1015 domain-containing protein [Treponema sp.]|nr:DUF1015 domain-containing protein [Treponema sp.]